MSAFERPVLAPVIPLCRRRRLWAKTKLLKLGGETLGADSIDRSPS